MASNDANVAVIGGDVGCPFSFASAKSAPRSTKELLASGMLEWAMITGGTAPTSSDVRDMQSKTALP